MQNKEQFLATIVYYYKLGDWAGLLDPVGEPWRETLHGAGQPSSI